MFHGVNHLWFIPYILFCYLLTPLFYDLKKFFKKKAKDSNLKYIIYVLIFMMLLEVFGYAFKSYFAACRINCYVMGFFLFPALKEKFTKNNIFLYMLQGLILVGVMYSWYKLRYIIKPAGGTVLIKNLVNLGINYSCVIQAFVLFNFYVLGGKIFSKIKLVRKVLDFSDYYSFDIYICHMIYVKGTLNLLKVTNSYAINIFIILVLSILSGVVLKHISKLFNRRRKNILEDKLIKL